MKRTKFALVIMTVVLFAAVSSQATSHVRIVRLSYESGTVKMDRATGQGLERALLNAPIVEGSRILTGNDGLAEVEFENNSVVRIGEATEVRFRQLLMNDAGYKVNEVELVHGTLYVDARSEKGDIYRVVAEDQIFEVQRNSQVRFLTSGNQVQVAVLNGSTNFETAPQPVAIKKSVTLTVDSANPSGYLATKGVDKVPLDAWNSERAAYQNAYSYNNGDGYGSKSMGGAGYSDLAYYGAFQYLPGWGLAWQPYGASGWMGWDPYSSGAWMLASGGQYAWASAYPWGWMPYHYGAWVYVPAGGWYWTPGNSFNGGGVITNWRGTAPVVNAPAGYTAPAPPTTPTNGHRPTVLVGQIGRMPAYIPGGPVPPNFRSVIQDHSGLAGVRAPLTGTSNGGGSGASAAARSSRAVNSRGTDSTARTGSSFASPRVANSANASMGHNASGGHVFVTPQLAMSTWNSEGFGTAPTPSPGRSSGAAMSSSGGAGRATGSSGGHAVSGGSPK